LLLLAALSFAGFVARASPSVVDFKRYASASGKYVLEIDPTELHGGGPGRYRLLVGGEEAWSKTLPVTLYEAAVLEDGTTVGYAYNHDRAGFARPHDHENGPGNLYVVVIDPKGGLRLNEITKRRMSQMLHAPAEPVATGMILQEDQDRFIIRTSAEREETWWSYRCSTGKPLARLDLRKASAAPESARFPEAAQAVPGTPLILVRWYAYDNEKNQRRALMMLVAADLQAVWSRDFPVEDSSKDEETLEKLRTQIDKAGLFLDVKEPGQFELWLPAEAQAARFKATRDESLKEGWRIEETGRRPYQPPLEEKPAPPAFEQRPLALLGSFPLESVAPAGPIHDVHAFEFDAEGRIGIMRRGAPNGETFSLLDADGNVLAEVPVPKRAYDAEVGNVSAAYAGAGKWVLVASEPRQEARSWAWWFDPAEKSLSKPIPLACPEIGEVAGDGEGGFVVLAKRRSRFSSTDEMHGFDRQGSHSWAVMESNDGNPGSLFSPEDVTVTTKGEVAVVDNIHKAVQIFGLDGKFRRVVDLKKSWKREPNYPSEIMYDLRGGFIVRDFNGEPPFVRMRADGSVRGALRPRHQDGRLVDTVAGLCVAPDGRVWACDEHALLRLDDDGVVDFTLGRDPRPDELDKIARVAGDGKGHVYAVDERTGAVHVFDAEGKKLRTCKPNPGDFKENLRWPSLAVADDGCVYIGSGDFGTGKPAYLHFGPDGRRLGFRDFKLENLNGVYVQPGTENLLLTDYHFAGLVGPNGKVLRDIDRRADRRWLDDISEAAFASDGSFAIHSEQSGVPGEDPSITLFAKDGTPTRTFALPSGLCTLLGYNGAHLVLRRDKSIEIYDSGGAPVQAFPAPDENESGMFLTREGRELWNVDFTTRVVQRYAMP